MTDLFERPSYYDQVALDAARQIDTLPSGLHPSQRTARIQLIVLKAMCHTSSLTDDAKSVNDLFRKIVYQMTPAEQYDLAFKVAENIGYSLLKNET